MFYNLSRRQFTFGAATFALGSLVGHHARALPNDSGNIAIIDASSNLKKWAPQLRSKGVRIVGRYYARRFQSKLPWKRLTADVQESKILNDAGIAILAIYQYQSNNEMKFLQGLPDTGSAAKEAESDARGALQGAKTVNQPRGTAIYFGVDFDCTKKQINSVIDYFEIINRIVGAEYKIGVYSNGYVNGMLREKGLVEYSMVSASRNYAGTRDFISRGEWHLFQNKIERWWFATDGRCPPRSGLQLDTIIQNPKYLEIGAWGGEGVNQERTQAIFDQRRFVSQPTGVYTTQGGSALISKTRCVQIKGAWRRIPENQLSRGVNVRILADLGDWVQIDINDDGVADGYCLKAHLTSNFATMPA